MQIEQVGEDQWLTHVLDPRSGFEVNRRWFGEAVRRDGWSCRDRREPWHLIYVAIEGRSVGSAGQVDITMEPGVVLWLPPGCAHQMNWSPTFRYVELWVAVTRGGRHLSPWRQPRRWGAGGGHSIVDRSHR